MDRRFAGKQRTALFLAADGKCSNCGKPLEPNWHADHVHPFSKGGETDVVNGQAMCPRCNLEKSDRMSIRVWPERVTLRKWQREAISKYDSTTDPDFMAVATPGAGKTLFALRVAHNLFSGSVIDQIVVVCPTDHIRRQWADKANEIGLDLDRYYTNVGRYRQEMHGVVLTYHQVGRLSDLHRWNCSKGRTLVIFDEIHHAGDENSWGVAVRNAFGPAVKRLLLSGTPFRSDNKDIPYVRYENNESRADYTFGYGRALDENDVVRLIEFVVYQGSALFLDKGELVDVTFDDELPEAQSAKRLRIVLSDTGEWLPDVLRDADTKLTEVRNDGHPNAGALVICMDQDHAREVVKHLTSITKTAPALAVSDDPDASEVIARFAKGHERWIVAVKMVSEGVDIPRLRVGVYATNVASELFFRQAVGRFIRLMAGVDNDMAHLFIPKDPGLTALAERIKQEIFHYLRDEANRESNGTNGNGNGNTGMFLSGESGNASYDMSIFDEKQYLSNDLDYAQEMGHRYGIRGQAVQIAALLRDHGITRTATPEPNGDPVPHVAMPKGDRIKKLRSAVSKQVGRLHFAINQKYDYAFINWRLQLLDSTSQANASEEQLHKRLEQIAKWQKKAANGTDPFTS